MPNPKHKTTKSKVGMRRSHHHPSTLLGVKCENCGELKQAHTVCPSCGTYKGRKVVADTKEVTPSVRDSRVQVELSKEDIELKRKKKRIALFIAFCVLDAALLSYIIYLVVMIFVNLAK